MAPIVVIGEAARVRGFALAGAIVHVADEPGEVRAAWGARGDAAVVVLTPQAAAALAGRLGEGPPTAVMPS